MPEVVVALVSWVLAPPAAAVSPSSTYIVMLQAGQGVDPATAAADAARQSGGVAGFVYGHTIQGFSLTASSAAADALRRNPNVASVTVSGIRTYDLQRRLQRRLPRRLQRRPPRRSLVPRGVWTGLTSGPCRWTRPTPTTRPEPGSSSTCDTGIKYTRVDFGGRASAAFDAINDGTAVNDCQGHSTHVAGTIGGATYGVAKNVTLKSVRVLDCTGNGTDA